MPSIGHLFCCNLIIWCNAVYLFLNLSILIAITTKGRCSTKQINDGLIFQVKSNLLDMSVGSQSWNQNPTGILEDQGIFVVG
jgi:hypothetical protein